MPTPITIDLERMPPLLQQHLTPSSQDTATQVDLDTLTLYPELLRAGLNQEKIDEYADIYRSGKDLPPLVVFADADGSAHVGDGLHRIAGARAAGRTWLWATVKPGTRRDALWYGSAANAQHGVATTNADKRRIVTTILSDETWRTYTDGRIAEHCHVSPSLVATLRKELGFEAKVRTGKGGRVAKTPGPKTAPDPAQQTIAGAIEQQRARAEQARPAIALEPTLAKLHPAKRQVLAAAYAVDGSATRKELAAVAGVPTDTHLIYLAKKGHLTWSDHDNGDRWRLTDPTREIIRKAIGEGKPKRAKGEKPAKAAKTAKAEAPAKTEEPDPFAGTDAWVMAAYQAISDVIDDALYDFTCAEPDGAGFYQGPGTTSGTIGGHPSHQFTVARARRADGVLGWAIRFRVPAIDDERAFRDYGSIELAACPWAAAAWAARCIAGLARCTDILACHEAHVLELYRRLTHILDQEAAEAEQRRKAPPEPAAAPDPSEHLAAETRRLLIHHLDAGKPQWCGTTANLAALVVCLGVPALPGASYGPELMGRALDELADLVRAEVVDSLRRADGRAVRLADLPDLASLWGIDDLAEQAERAVTP